MIRSRMLWRLYGGYVLLILFMAVSVGLLVGNRIERDTMREIQESLQAKASLLAKIGRPFLDRPVEPKLQEDLRSLGGATGTRLTVIAADGRVLGDSHEDPSEMDDHGSRPEVLEARQDLVSGGRGLGQATRFSRTLQSEMMYVALAVPGPDGPVGHVRASLPVTAVGERLAEVRAIVVFGAAIAAVLALVIGFFATRRITAPLISMTEVAEAIAAGDYSRRVGPISDDEAGKLARAFDTMAAQLEGRVETITRDRNQLLAILGGMIEGVVAVDRQTNVVHMNAVAGQILGADPAASVGKPIWEVTRIREIAENLVRTAEGSRERREEVQLIRPGSERIIETCASPLRNGDGRPAGAVMVLHDVSELRRLEVVRREFVANASHELKTPITAIRGLVDTLVEDQELDADTRARFLDKVRRQSDRLATMVSDLLTLSSLESRQIATERPLDLCDVVLESVRALTTVAEEKGLEIHTEVPDRAVTVTGDGETLREIVDNLLDNAIKYNPPPGRVDVRLRIEGPRAILEVEDDGPGIAPAEQERIFERFYRVDRARSRELGGTGLGLAIVRHAVVRSGGEVGVQSTPGSGSKFSVKLPLASGGG